ncbi:MAG: N-methyl-L-tryptophan oxidase [Rubrobacteraceae bacterium]
MSNGYDAIVVGLGAMGSAAAYHLARRGYRVLGLDAHPRDHMEGSSNGRSRIIREAYAEGEEYVPLARRAYELWRELERESGRNLLTVVGGLVVGEAGSDLTEGVVRSARRHDLPYEELSPEEASARFPGLRLADDLVAVFEAGAGILEPQACIDAHLEVAAAHGADLRHAEPVRRWETDGDGVRVETDRGLYEAERLVVTTGPWAGELLSDLRLPLSVKRVVNVHFECPRPELFDAGRFPVCILDVPEGVYYSLPALPGQGIKIGRHDGGEECTPGTIRREVAQPEVAMLREVLDSYLPGAAGPVKWTLTCMYTMTPDGHFVIDRHARHSQVVYGCGFSGHGFKFAGVVGEILADLALEGETEHPIELFSASRLPSRTVNP